jgi:hypothetical protein
MLNITFHWKNVNQNCWEEEREWREREREREREIEREKKEEEEERGVRGGEEREGRKEKENNILPKL